MSTGHTLLQKTLLPLAAMSLVLCTVVFWAVSAAQQDVLSGDLAKRARLAASGLEYDLHNGQSTAEALDKADAVAGTSLGLARWFLVDLSSQQVISASDKAVGSGDLSRIASLGPLASGRSEWRTGDEGSIFVYSLPITVPATSTSRLEGDNDLRLVAFMDGSGDLQLRREKLLRLLGVSLIIMLAFVGGVVLTLRRKVLKPLRAIQQALSQSRAGDTSLAIGGLEDDEIGELGSALQGAFERLSQSERFIGSIFHSLSGCAYSVDARNGQVLQFTGNMDKRDDGRSLWNPLELDAEQRQELGAAIARSEPWDMEYAVSTAEGNIRWVNNRGRLIRDRFGEAVSYDGLVLDVTDNRLRSDQVRLFSEALRKSSNEVFVVDLASQTLQFANDAALRNVGYSLEELIGLPNTALARDMLRPEVVAEMSRMFETRDEIHFQYEHTRRDGSTYPFEFTATPVQQQGRTQFIVVGSDITERLQREAVIRSGEERLKLALEGSDYGMFVFDRRTGESYISESVQEWAGRTVDNIDDVNALIESIEPAYREELRRQLGATDEPVREFNVELCTAGDRRCLHLRGKAYYRADGRIERLIGFAADVTRQNVAEKELHRALEAAQSATRAKSEFLATMSHEIRTPMNGVLGMTQLLLDMDLNAAQKETAGLILRSGEALLAIINDILDFSKIEAGKLDLESIVFDLEHTTREVMDLMSGSARGKALDLYVDYDASLPLRHLGDEGRLRQILLNLVGNAIKFTTSGHVLVRVAPSADGKVRFIVRDTGPGIDPEVKGRLFDSFTQGDASTTRKFGGTGLGLAICKKLVELMEGTIGVDSVPGQGSTFWFEIPLRVADADSIVAAERLAAQALSGVNVLVVDDNPVGRDILDSMLRSLGASVAVAADLETTRARLGQERFDLVVLDYHMPDRDGLGIAREIRDNPATSALRILMLSSSDVPVEAQKQAGLDAFSTKPVMKRGLLRLCQSVLTGSADGVDAAATDATPRPDDNDPSRARVRILLAEDNVVNQKVAVRMLEKLGCRVDVAANGKEAFELWRQFPYSMIFMDCQMPELDGLAATRMIRERERADERIPIVAMTANALERDREACIAAGMDDYASKPVKLDLLGHLLERYARGGATGFSASPPP